MEVDLVADVEAGEEAVETNEVTVDWDPEEAQEAEAMGWIPPERAKKLPEGKSFVGPKEFMERNPLYKQMKDLQFTVKELAAHNQRISEIEHKKAEKEFEAKLAELKEEKVRALDDADHARVVEIDEEIRATEKPVKEAEDPVFTKWVDENKWYNDDAFLRVEATKVGEILYSDKLYGKELLNAVKDHLKQAYPDKFENPNRNKASSVEGGSNGVSKPKTVTAKDLTEDERSVFNNFKQMGVFTAKGAEQKYLNEVIALRD